MKSRNTKSRTQPNSRANKKVKRSSQKVQLTTTNVPYVQAVQVVQSAPMERIIRESGSDIIGRLSLTSTSKPGEIVGFEINPARMEGTRLNSLLTNYQKYRFVRGSRFSIVTNQPSTVGGSLVVGYSSNPDMDILEGAIASVYALPGAQIAPMFVPVNIGMSTPDSRWLNFDPDSDEKMMTTAGKLFVGLQSSVNITGATNIPIVMHWNVEMTGASTVTRVISTVLDAPLTMTSVSAEHDVYLRSNGNIVPKLTAGTCYIVSPSLTFTVAALKAGNLKTSETVANFCEQGEAKGGVAYRFYDTYNNFLEDKRIRVQFQENWQEEGITLTPLN